MDGLVGKLAIASAGPDGPNAGCHTRLDLQPQLVGRSWPGGEEEQAADVAVQAVHWAEAAQGHAVLHTPARRVVRQLCATHD
jgi:hypothetical protein